MPYFWDTVPETSPQPELNPLTNPVLERNLGRWAQAYFSNPPGQRELAISKLLEEIKSETSDILTAERARREFSARPSEARSPDARSSESGSSTIESPYVRSGNVRPDEVSSNEARHSAVQPNEVRLKDERIVTCSVCKHQNAERERFCGQCGAALNSVESASENRNRKENTSEEMNPLMFLTFGWKPNDRNLTWKCLTLRRLTMKCNGCEREHLAMPTNMRIRRAMAGNIYWA